MIQTLFLYPLDLSLIHILEIGEVKVKKNSTGSTELTGADISVASGDYFNVTKLTVKVQVADGVYTFVSVSVPGAITDK